MKIVSLNRIVGVLSISLAASAFLFAQNGEFSIQKLKESMRHSMLANSIRPMRATCPSSPFKIVSGHIDSQIGDIVKIGNKRYKIHAFPFIDYETGDHYYLKVPVEISKYGKTTTSMYFYYQTEYVKGGSACYPYKLNGYPSSNNQIFYEEYFTFHKNRFNKQSEEGFSYFNNVLFSTSVLVGKTNLTFSLTMTGVSSTVHSKDADYSDDVEWSKLNAKLRLINNIRTWVKYIEIVKMP